MKTIIKILKKLIWGILVLLAIFFYLAHQERQEEKRSINRKIKIVEETWDTENKYFDDQITLDINGDGVKEKLVNMDMRLGDKNNPEHPFLAVFNYEGKEVAKTPEWMGSAPLTLQMQAYRLDGNDLRESVGIEFVAGPHQSEMMFFRLDKNMLLPICFVVHPESLRDCLFYAEDVGGLIVKDLDNNGLLDIVEVASEYPSTDKQLSSEAEKAIENTFGKDAENAKRIVLRGQNPGRPVAWNIYAFNGNYFERQLGKSYDKYFDLLAKDNPTMVKKSDMTKDSRKFIESTRDFWTHRNSERGKLSRLSAMEITKPLEFTEEQLRSYYSSYTNPFVIHVRKALDGYLDGSNYGMDDPEAVINPGETTDKSIDGLDSFDKSYYRSKFIVYAINNSMAGGKEISIVFQDKPDKLFTAWVYKLSGEGGYDLRGFWQDLSFDEKKMAKIRRLYKSQLEDKEHAM